LQGEKRFRVSQHEEAAVVAGAAAALRRLLTLQGEMFSCSRSIKRIRSGFTLPMHHLLFFNKETHLIESSYSLDSNLYSLFLPMNFERLS